MAQMPMDGHCLLLIEAEAGKRTFSDYQNVVSCLDKLLDIYEQAPDHDENYTLDVIFRWLDKFNRIVLMVFDEELARYKKLKHSELKALFIPAIQRSHNRQENGITTNNCDNNQREPHRSEDRTRRFRESDGDEDEDDEEWN